MLMRAHYIFDGDVCEKTRERMKEEYNKLRDIAVTFLNPHFEKWNEEYGEVKDLADYNRFIQKKERDIIRFVNIACTQGMCTYLDADEDADIIGKLAGAPDVTMHLVLEPI